MTPLERLMAEAIPTGTFGNATPPKNRQPLTTPRWTAAEQAEHLRALAEALGTPHLRAAA